jgi:hypothetical protein
LRNYDTIIKAISKANQIVILPPTGGGILPIMKKIPAFARQSLRGCGQAGMTVLFEFEALNIASYCFKLNIIEL